MKSVLILYDTVEGQTKKIALYIGEVLKAEGHSVRILRPDEFHGSLEAYDSVIVGGPVHIQKYPKKLRSWVGANAKELQPKLTAFFSVCLGILQKDDPRVQEAEKKIALDFLAKSNWQPDVIEIFGGALAYTKYNWLTKMMLRMIAKKAGGSMDTTKDHEYTDWQQVRGFAEAFSSLLKSDVKASTDQLSSSSRDSVAKPYSFSLR